MTQVVPFPQASQQPQVLNQGQLMNALQLFEASVPVVTAQNNDRLKAMLGDLGGDSRNRLSIKAGRFRQIVGGNEIYVHPLPSLDVVILGAVPYVSRSFYAAAYQEGVDAKPACSSANGVDSDPSVENRQSAKCADCVQNQKGSKTNQDGKAGKACRYYKRVAVMVWGDPEGRVYQLDLPAASIFGDGMPQQGKLSFSKYAQLLAQRGVDPLGIVTRIEFDMSASAPELLFSPASNAEGTAIQFIPAEYQQAFLGLSESPSVKDICTVAAPGTVVQVGNAPALAAPVQHAAPQIAAPVQAPTIPAMPSTPQVQAQPQVQAPVAPAMPSAIPNVPPMPQAPVMPASPQAPAAQATPTAQPAAAATAPVSQPVMPTGGASATNVVAPAPAVASVPAMPAMPQVPVMPSAPTAPTPQAAAAAPAATMVELAPIGAAEVESWLAGLSAPAAQ